MGGTREQPAVEREVGQQIEIVTHDPWSPSTKEQIVDVAVRCARVVLGT